MRFERDIRWNEICGWMKKPFLWLCLLYVLALMSLLRANFSYVDDMGRATMGDHFWLDWSRYVTMGLSFLVQPTPKLTDISPLPQLLAAALLSLAGVVVIYCFTQKKEISWPFLLAALPMGLSPWFLQCFSYKFDAPYMAVAVLSSILPFLWWEKDEKKFYVASFLCLLVMTMTYQAASGIFIIETLFLFYLSWLRGGKGKVILLWVIRAAIIYVAALLTFKLFFLRPPIMNYASTELVPLVEMPHVFLKHAAAYLQTAWKDLNFVAQILVIAVVPFWLLSARRVTKRNWMLTLLVSVVFLSATVVLSYGPYLVLEKTFLRPRGLLGMGVWFSFALTALLSMSGGKGMSKWLAVLVAWQLMAGATAYGDALAGQKRYTDFRVQLVVQDLNALHLTGNNEIKYHILGDIGKSALVRNAEREYPAVKRLLLPTFSGADVWSMFYFYFYHDLGGHAEGRVNPQNYIHLPVVLENRYHKIQTDGKDVLIVLHESS